MPEDTDPTIDDDLAYFMADQFGPTTNPFDLDAEPPHIEDQAGADKLLFLIRRAEDSIAKLEATAREQNRMVAAWLADRRHSSDRVIAWAARSLENWARQMHAEGGGPTWNLPHGVVKLNATRDRLVVTDEEAATTFLAATVPHLVKTERTVKIKEAMKALTREGSEARLASTDLAGKAVPGLEWVDAGERNFSQKPPPDRHTPAADLDPPETE